MHYRILKPVSKPSPADGGHVGSICTFDWLTEEQQQILIDRGVISPISAPPLAELPGFIKRAERLQEFGIETAEAFLDADPEEVAKQYDVKPRTVRRWQDELLQLLILPHTERRG